MSVSPKGGSLVGTLPVRTVPLSIPPVTNPPTARRSLTRLGTDDTGSTLILVIFYTALCLAVILVGTTATSLYLERKRLFSLADGAALAAAQSFTTVTGNADTPRFELTDTAVAEAASRYLGAVRSSGDVVLLRADTPDGVAARIELRTEWQPPLVSAFVSAGVPIEVTSTATVSVG